MTSAKLVETMTPRRPSECSCSKCRSMCKRCPCLGTPEDILRLIEHGHGGDLKRTLWCALEGTPGIDMVQLQGNKLGGGRCIKFDGRRCTIHDLKPTEGKLATHEPIHLLLSPTWAVAVTWMLPENRALVARLFELYP